MNPSIYGDINITAWLRQLSEKRKQSEFKTLILISNIRDNESAELYIGRWIKTLHQENKSCINSLSYILKITLITTYKIYNFLNALWFIDISFIAHFSYKIAAKIVTTVYLLLKYPQYLLITCHCVNLLIILQLKTTVKNTEVGEVAKGTKHNVLQDQAEKQLTLNQTNSSNFWIL